MKQFNLPPSHSLYATRLRTRVSENVNSQRVISAEHL